MRRLQDPSARISARMAELGHWPHPDGSHHRYTCRNCDRAGLNAGGPDYGSALEEPCPGREPRMWPRGWSDRATSHMTEANLRAARLSAYRYQVRRIQDARSLDVKPVLAAARWHAARHRAHLIAQHRDLSTRTTLTQETHRGH